MKKQYYLKTKNLLPRHDEDVLTVLDKSLTELCTRMSNIKWNYVVTEKDGKVIGSDTAFNFKNCDNPILAMTEVKMIFGNAGVECEEFTEDELRKEVMRCSTDFGRLICDDFWV